MPGSGKSTIGRRLAKHRGLRFLDTDDLLEQQANMHIQDIVNRLGVKYLRSIEGQALSKLDVQNYVISTTGQSVRSALLN